jgi:hypothetical protein
MTSRNVIAMCAYCIQLCADKLSLNGHMCAVCTYILLWPRDAYGINLNWRGPDCQHWPHLQAERIWNQVAQELLASALQTIIYW